MVWGDSRAALSWPWGRGSSPSSSRPGKVAMVTMRRGDAEGPKSESAHGPHPQPPWPTACVVAESGRGNIRVKLQRRRPHRKRGGDPGAARACMAVVHVLMAWCTWCWPWCLVRMRRAHPAPTARHGAMGMAGHMRRPWRVPSRTRGSGFSDERICICIPKSLSIRSYEFEVPALVIRKS